MFLPDQFQFVTWGRFRMFNFEPDIEDPWKETKLSYKIHKASSFSSSYVPE